MSDLKDLPDMSAMTSAELWEIHARLVERASQVIPVEERRILHLQMKRCLGAEQVAAFNEAHGDDGYPLSIYSH